VAAAVAAGLAWRAGGLTGRGAVAAWAVGTLVVWGTGWEGGAILAAFFVPSTLVSRGTPPPLELDPKEGSRDARQVLANGGVAALVSLVGLREADLGLWLLTCALAAASADTWASALGARSRTPPRMLWSGRPVLRGTSGAVTPLGCAGAAAGAGVVSAVAVAVGSPPSLFLPAVLIGFAGMVADSWLGATLQGRFHCPVCRQESEWPVHRCGARTLHQGGARWLDNDGVNLIATAFAAALGLSAWAWL
jgi:uncharacterized protein (TIGR00297 family)